MKFIDYLRYFPALTLAISWCGFIDGSPETEMDMATKITSYNPCKEDPYGASSMPIYQVFNMCVRQRISGAVFVVSRHMFCVLNRLLDVLDV